MMAHLTLTDRCTADDTRKPEPYVIDGSGPFSISGDTLLIGDRQVAFRIEPHGFGDVHWEILGGDPATPVAFRRFTHIEVR